MIKKTIDVVSLGSVAVPFCVIVWAAIWGESPRAPGHLSMQSTILVWDAAPAVFGVNWLIFRYTKSAAKRFPLLFSSPEGRGLLFYFVVVLVVVVVLERGFIFISERFLAN